jgi:Predicted membrane protein
LAWLSTALPDVLDAAGPPLLFGLRLWASVCLALYVAFWLQLENAFWAGTTAALVCQPQLGASLRKGWYRMVGTVVGAVAIVVLTACFPQDRVIFLLGLALWGAVCTFVATLLRNYAAYAAALAGFTAAIIASDQLGATGGLDGQAFMLAVTRVSEICLGIVCAGVVLAGTEFGSSRRGLAKTMAAVSAEIASRFVRTLARLDRERLSTQALRRDLYRRVIALDPVIDAAIGESSAIRYHSPVLQAAVDGMLAALAGWRTVAVRLGRLRDHGGGQEADIVLQHVPAALRSSSVPGEPAAWLADPLHLSRLCEIGVRALNDLSAPTPSLRLIADRTASVLTGLARALAGLALLVAEPRHLGSPRETYRFYVPDALPALANAGRAFVAIGATALLWIVTAWPNGGLALVFAAASVAVFAPRADEAYASAMMFMIGTALAAVCAALLAFAVLPQFVTFAGLALVIGLYLVPVGALMAQPWQPVMFAAMAGNFVPLLAPSNQMSYDTLAFYNSALAIVVGCGIAALSFRLLPPLSPALRTRRILSLSRRDLRRMATNRRPPPIDAWEGRMYSRLAALPNEASPLQRAQLITALSVGSDILQLREMGVRLAVTADLDDALQSFADGRSAIAIAQLRQWDRRLASHPAAAAGTTTILRARGLVLTLCDALADYGSFFDESVPA